MLDLLDVNLEEASGTNNSQTDPWGVPIAAPPPPRPQVDTKCLYKQNEYTFKKIRYIKLWSGMKR